MTPSRTIGQACRQLHPIGHHLTDAATILREMHDELPKRGHLVDLYHELLQTLAHIETTYRDGDQYLLQAYRELEHGERAAAEGWTPQPLNGHHNNGQP